MSKENILIVISICAYPIAILVENYISIKKNKKWYERKDTFISFWLGLAGAGMDILFKTITFLVLDWCNDHAIYEPNLTSHYPVFAWLLVFIGQDFCFYWLHRVEHTSRVFWTVHSNHHSSPKYNFAVALRSSVFQPMYRFMFYVPIAFLGFDGLTIMFIYAVNQFYQFWLHTESIPKLPNWFEKIFVTPSHHRVHHASNVQYLDKNMGQVLIIWDRIFGTFEEEIEKPIYGLTKPLDTSQPFKVILHEQIKLAQDLRKSKKWSIKLKYIFAPPGWSHDGSTLTSEQLRKQNMPK